MSTDIRCRFDVYQTALKKSSQAGRSLLATVRNIQPSSPVMAEIESGLQQWQQPTLIVWGNERLWPPFGDGANFIRYQGRNHSTRERRSLTSRALLMRQFLEDLTFVYVVQLIVDEFRFLLAEDDTTSWQEAKAEALVFLLKFWTERELSEVDAFAEKMGNISISSHNQAVTIQNKWFCDRSSSPPQTYISSLMIAYRFFLIESRATASRWCWFRCTVTKFF